MSVKSFELPVRNPGRFFIGGEWVIPSTESMFDVIQPATEETFCQVAEAKGPDMERAIASARTAFDDGPWAKLSHSERAGYLRLIGDAIRRRGADLGGIWTSEMGVVHAIAEVASPSVGRLFDYYADLSDSFPFVEQHQPSAGGNVGLLLREPVGVVGVIVPWNVPLALMAQKMAPALLAGCTVIIKSSPEAPGAGYVMGEIADLVGVPPGVINCLTADREVSELLVRDSRIDKIAFTGSTAAGRRIAALCGERIARCTLELGGKSAALVLDDYDVGEAAESIAGQATLMTGQVCAALTRVVVSRGRHDQMVEALSSSFSKVRIGNPFDSMTEMGPLAMRRQLERVEHLVEKGKEEGAELVSGGRRPPEFDRGFYFEPTVFGNVDNHSTIAREEIFGPVLCVIPAADERHAVEIANDSIYGLNASVFTTDTDHAFEIAKELRSGTVGHNSVRYDVGIAFGGYKQSGIGREGGHDGLRPYLETKTVILDEQPTSMQ